MTFRKLAAVAIATACLVAPRPGETQGLRIMLAEATIPPIGFNHLCGSYDWLCYGKRPGTITDQHQIRARATQVNERVNMAIEPMTDMEQYDVAEKWTLPVSGKGDCEDYALLKKKTLIEKGVPPERLLMALASSTAQESHAVLVLRLDDGDYVLDNLTPEVIPWRQWNHRIEAMQDPDDPSRWLSATRQIARN